jgi:hypothetical protein
VELTFDSHLFGETIIRTHFASQAEDIIAVLGRMEVPLRDARPFASGRGKANVPKRQSKGKKYTLYPADLPALNVALDSQLRQRGWTAQPYASADVFASTKDRSRGDFFKDGVFVEVEFGNTASLFRDLFKFQVASRERQGEAAILVVAYRGLARFHDSGIATFEKLQSVKEYLSLVIQMPIWMIGIKPPLQRLKEAYEDMYEEAVNVGGLECRSWSAALGGDYEEDGE